MVFVRHHRCSVESTDKHMLGNVVVSYRIVSQIGEEGAQALRNGSTC
jgi:hypothetical protein